MALGFVISYWSPIKMIAVFEVKKKTVPGFNEFDGQGYMARRKRESIKIE